MEPSLTLHTHRLRRQIQRTRQNLLATLRKPKHKTKFILKMSISLITFTIRDARSTKISGTFRYTLSNIESLCCELIHILPNWIKTISKTIFLSRFNKLMCLNVFSFYFHYIMSQFPSKLYILRHKQQNTYKLYRCVLCIILPRSFSIKVYT